MGKLFSNFTEIKNTGYKQDYIYILLNNILTNLNNSLFYFQKITNNILLNYFL